MLNRQPRPVSIGRAASAFMPITLLVTPAQAEMAL
jgi:hypothetical protein